MPVSERDRQHFEAIRLAKATEATERAREADARPMVERMVEGLALGAAAASPEIEAELDRRALGQGELQARARRLGLR